MQSSLEHICAIFCRRLKMVGIYVKKIRYEAQSY